ncbi:MAG TPA: class I SAM-dependent rRNA methyltransferase [Candidatus Peribacteraceae bacterium]|nr:class I SAM-dependent rRNA methyltransferase [Candidatus Peribacteraceae bacterium]
MPDYPVLRLKKDREGPLKNRHHAIYKNAFESVEGVPTGSIVEVRSSEDEFLCFATINTRAYICGRAIAFEEGDPLQSLKRTMKRSIDLRRQFFSAADTTAYRLINAEGDFVPGLIADRYGEIVVVQITTLGMDRLRDWITNVIGDLAQTERIFEKSTGASRKSEGLEPREQWLRGSGETTLEVTERGLKFQISLTGSQKTGLFLDQREMRSLVKQLAPGRTVLDCCSYVGGFALSALSGGAIAADAVDYDPVATDHAKEHVTLNGFDLSQFNTYTEDVFDFLRRSPLPREYDFIVLDPPAFAKRHDDLEMAKHTYTDLNRSAMQAIMPGGLLLTCSCSYQITPEIFQTIVFHAARQAGRNVRILQRHHLAYDHPVNIYYPETDYLKSLLLWVE